MIYSRWLLSQWDGEFANDQSIINTSATHVPFLLNLDILEMQFIYLFIFLLSGDAVPKFSSDNSVPDEPRLLLYLNRELSTSVQTG